MTTWDDAAMARFDRLYSTPQVVGQRRLLRRLLDVRPGEVGVDVGCGAGHMAAELARELGPLGRIVGIDVSEAAVSASRTRLASDESPIAASEFHVADAIALPLDDGSVDFVVATQVLCYVAELGRALAEVRRVLKPGGRFAIIETDWTTCIWKATDRALMQRMLAARAATQFVDSHLPEQLPRLLQAAGFEVAAIEAYPILEVGYDPNAFSADLVGPVKGGAARHGIEAGEIARWEADVDARRASGDWFFCLNRFVFLARSVQS